MTTKRRRTSEKTCAECGVTFQARSDSAGRFCSRQCWYWRSTDTLEARLIAGTDRSAGPDGCWPWLCFVNVRGYGEINSGQHSQSKAAHKVAYRLAFSEIPDGHLVDHTCHNADLSCEGGSSCLHRRCVNPGHLEAVEPIVNVLRGKGPTAINSKKRACLRGHPFDMANTRFYIAKGGRVQRKCRACQHDRNQNRSADPFWTGATAAPMPMNGARRKTRAV
jgi:hypothetical protein